jgi:hypothetical protein
MNSEATLSDSEHWSEHYESETVATTSRLSPVLYFVLLAASSHAFVPVGPIPVGVVHVGTSQAFAPTSATAEHTIEGEVIQPVVVERSDQALPALLSPAPVDIFDPTATMALAGLSKEVFPNSRGLTPEEEKATDAFFLSHFR